MDIRRLIRLIFLLFKELECGPWFVDGGRWQVRKWCDIYSGDNNDEKWRWGSSGMWWLMRWKWQMTITIIVAQIIVMQKVGNDNTTGMEIYEFGLAIQKQINKVWWAKELVGAKLAMHFNLGDRCECDHIRKKEWTIFIFSCRNACGNMEISFTTHRSVIIYY